MKSKCNPNVSRIRSLGVTKINQLVAAARHLPQLTPAFAEWREGEIYVCKKTATYRYRFGDKSKSIAPWSGVATKLFRSPAAFAFAAMVFDSDTAAPVADQAPAAAPASAGRSNIIHLARGKEAA